MHKILQPEQLKAMAQEIETSFDTMVPTFTHKVLTIEQFYTLHNEVFLVEMELDRKVTSSVLVCKNTSLDRWEPVSLCTFRAPDFTHGSQKDQKSDEEEMEQEQQTTYQPGWGKSPASRKWHYFPLNDTVSLCGTIGMFMGEREDTHDESKENCATCKKKVVVLRKKEVAK